MEDLLVVLLIVFIVFLVIAVVAIIVLSLRLESLVAALGIWSLEPRGLFTSISYPPSMPPPPTPEVFDVEVALLAVGACMSTSNLLNGGASLLPSYLQVQTRSDLGVVYVPTTPSSFRAVVAFRDLLDRPSDVLTDLNWSQTEYAGLGNVHAGLAQLADQVYPTIRQAVAGRTPLLICGHGPGGGVGALVAARLAQDLGPGTQIYLYTSSYPRVGDLTWQNNFIRLMTDWWVLNNVSDVVPEVPFPAIVIQGTGYAYATPPIDRLMIFDYQAASPSANEDPRVYQHMLVPSQIPAPSTPLWTSPLTPVCS